MVRLSLFSKIYQVACAAPGNKTTHIAALIEPHGGQVFAFDMNKKRANEMKKRIKNVAPKVIVTHADFLKIDPTDARYKNVCGIIVDPSCSGSGMVKREEYSEKEEKTEKQEEKLAKRLEKLAAVQKMLILHAMKCE